MIKSYRPGQDEKRHGTEAERHCSERLGAVLTPASGALDFAKGDMTLGRFRIESKSTIHSSIRLQLKDLLKINQEALEKAEIPALVIQFVLDSGKIRSAGSWVLVPENVFKELLPEDES